ncbi:zinc finger protein 282-like [Rhinatrema bivittatum]|uniref:zinc finger protein 282-like n=1 Tax=Rhinatrema bivittatum TaxID=194408 RepID=UPI00112A3F96|nr:zinc finger protein 282-like [Rhinatrema bivittatum]
MAEAEPAQVPVTFEDVAVYFSEDEWEMLEEWQKELYKKTMEENYETVTSLDPSSGKPSLISKIEREEDPWVGKQQDPRDRRRLESSWREPSGPRQQPSDASWEGPGTSRDPPGLRRPPMLTRPFHMDATTQWSESEEEEEVRPSMAPTGSPLTLTEALEELEWGTSPTPLQPSIPGSFVGSPPTPVLSPCSPAPAAGAAMPMGHPPGPEEPPAAPPGQPHPETVPAAVLQQILMELRALRRVRRQQRRDFQLLTAAITQAGNSIAAAIATLNNILLQILQRMPDMQASSATSTPQPSPSGSRGRRGRLPKNLPPPSRPSRHGKGP